MIDQVDTNPNDDYTFSNLSDGTKAYAVRLFGILVSYMKGRPLQLIKFVPDSNGFLAWSILGKDLEPSTRQRSLALLTQLSRVSFAAEKTITEQLPAYET